MFLCHMKKTKGVKWMIWFGSFIILWFIIYLLNETPFLYQESSQYDRTDLSKVSMKEALPVFPKKIKRDTLIIFFHGYKGTPYNVKSVALSLRNKYDIAIGLFPGHGTSDADFQKTCFSQWYEYAKDIYTKYRSSYKHVYICGLSMGGTITLKIAEEYSYDNKMSPDGIITISSPAFLNNFIEKQVLYDWRLYFSRFLAWLIHSIPEHIKDVDQDGAKWLGYEGFNFPKQVHSFKMGMYDVRKNLKKIRIPLLSMQSKGDKTVPFENLDYIISHVSSSFIRKREFDLRKWSHKRHILTMYNTSKDIVRDEIVKFIQESKKK